ncbi:MAG TPA: hypothetical protein VFR07_12135 [Mycobacteriales bacterium]|jgi:hypothetical protein|nr:hypothetical protein [Mycobacteriales bacterium]
MSIDGRASRYAVPLATLLAGAAVPLEQQVTEQSVPRPEPLDAWTVPVGPEGHGDGDGD